MRATLVVTFLLVSSVGCGGDGRGRLDAAIDGAVPRGPVPPTPPTCNGAPLPCEGRADGVCNDGCRPGPGCDGPLRECRGSSQSDCPLYCRWDHDIDLCIGTPPAQCADYGRISCEAQFDCVWATECHGEAALCSSYANDECGDVGGCSLSCPEGRITCGELCIDSSADPSNCGSCGTVCPSVCIDGSCQVQSCDSRANCLADDGEPCNGDWACEDGACRTTAPPESCAPICPGTPCDLVSQ